MNKRKRKPVHPGIILDEHYIKPLGLNLLLLAKNLGLARNTLYKVRAGRAPISPTLAVRLSEAFDTTPDLWLNLQQKYDLWMEENRKPHKKVIPVYRAGHITQFFEKSA